MPYTIKHDRDLCTGCSTCAALCPGNWRMRPDGKSLPPKTRVGEIGCNKQAEQNCPVRCIGVVEEK